jgi:enoyl-[acyl-carrier protein] reductase III
MTATLVSTPTISPNITKVQQILSEVTRYPLDILEPNAELEEELGIDSVKLGEIFSVLSEHYSLPPMNEMDVPPERLRTIIDLAQIIDEFTSASKQQHNEASITMLKSETVSRNEINTSENTLDPSARRESSDTVSSSIGATLGNVQQILSEVTRYPLDILEPNAELEEELGIDSVKLGEIFSVLSEHYSLPPMNEMDVPPERLRTIIDLAQIIDEFTSASKQPADGEVSSSNKINLSEINNLDRASASGKELQSNNSHNNSSTVNQNHRGAFISANHNQVVSEPPLYGKIALVTGSGRGLGKVIAKHLAQLGATVIVNSFHSRDLGESTAAEIMEMGGKALHIWGSVANEEHLHRLFNQIESEFEHLDFFISNSSNGLLASLEDIKVEHLEKAFQTNVIGLHQGAIRASRLMRKRGGGKIVTLSTNAAHRYIPYFGCMATVKAGIEALTKYLAIELAPYNIQVNCVTSGPVYGELINKWPNSETLIPYWESISLGNELCYPEDVADLVSYLLREEVKRINGSILLVDAGQTIHL